MRSKKPDLLVVLSLILGVAVVVTTYGEKCLKSFDVQAHTPYKSRAK